jgi:hypothetical protein
VDVSIALADVAIDAAVDAPPDAPSATEITWLACGKQGAPRRDRGDRLLLCRGSPSPSCRGAPHPRRRGKNRSVPEIIGDELDPP